MFSQYTSPVGRRALRDDEGLTLIEIIIAGFVLSVAVLGLASIASASLMSVRDSRERDRATAAASSALEAVRAMTYDEIAMRTGDAWVGDDLVQADGSGGYEFDYEGDGTFATQTWAAGGGPVYPYLCTSDDPNACWFEMPEGTRVTVRTFVTWYPNAALQEGKRITAVATWEDPARTRLSTVRMTTIISPASRGLPAPAFEVLPRALAATLDEAAIDSGYEQCFQHTLSNYGAADSYDVGPDGSWLPDSPMAEGTWKHDSWVMRVYFIPVGMTQEPATLMKAETAVSGHLDTPYTLETEESATLLFCYTPRDGSTGGMKAEPGDVFTFTPTVRSKFDENVTQTVSHRINISVDPMTFYMHYEHDELLELLTYRPVRLRRPSDGILQFAQFPLNLDPPATQSIRPYDLEFRIGNETIDMTTARLNRDGLFLPRSLLPITLIPHTSRLFAAEWDHQFTGPVTFAGTAEVRIWTTRHGSETDLTGIPPEQVQCLRAQLVKLNRRGVPVTSPTNGIVGEATHTLPRSGGWLEHVFHVEWKPGGPGGAAGDVTFNKDEYLRLRIWNPGDLLSSNCVNVHIGFGASPNFMAHLRAWPK